MTELVVERRLTFNLAQAKALVEMFDGHSGPGLYACEAEYPEEGSHFLGPWR